MARPAFLYAAFSFGLVLSVAGCGATAQSVTPTPSARNADTQMISGRLPGTRVPAVRVQGTRTSGSSSGRVHRDALGSSLLGSSVPTRAFTEIQYATPSSMSYATLGTYVNVLFQPNSPAIAAAAQQAAMYTIGYFDVNRCSSASFKDANGLGGNPYGASPDCGSLPASAFYHQKNASGPVITASDGNDFVNAQGQISGGVISYFGDPGSTALQNAALGYVEDDYSGAYNAVMDDDTASLDEAFNGGSPFGAICNGVGTYEPAYATGGGESYAYSCTGSPGGPITAVDGNTDVTGYSASEFYNGEQKLINNLPKSVIVNSLQSVAIGETTSVSANIVATTQNALGGICEACFENNIYELQETLANVALAVNSGKAVIVTSESSTLTATQRESNLAALMLVYNPYLVYEGTSPSCTGASGLDLCPEVSLVFESNASYTRAGNGLLTRTGTCYVGGTDLGACVSEVNDNTSSSVSTVTPSGGLAVAQLTPNTSTDYVTCSASLSCFSVSPSVLIPSTLTPGQGVVGLILGIPSLPSPL